MTELPNRVRELRKARSWTLEKLANKCDCGITMISDLERGERELTYHWMKRIAHAFGDDVRAADLLLEVDNSRSLSGDTHELVTYYSDLNHQGRRQLIEIARILVPSPTKRKSPRH